jgi:hypothetical protein
MRRTVVNVGNMPSRFMSTFTSAYKGPRQHGGYKGPRQHGGYKGPRQHGGY